MTRVVINSCLVVSLMAPLAAAGLSTDADQPVNIEADQVEFDQAQGRTVYKGSVVLTQGSLRLSGDRMTLYLEDGKTLNKVLLTGRPARFKQTPDGGGADWKARSGRIEYLVGKNLIYLTRQAEVRQGDDVVTGDRIEYDTGLNRVRAGGIAGSGRAKKGSGRVKMTLQPK